MSRRPLTHHQRGDVHLFARKHRLLRTRKVRRTLAGEERGADLEQPNVALHAGEIVFSAGYESRQQVPTQECLVLRERIRDTHSRPVTLGDERHRPHLIQADADESFLQTLRHCYEWRVGDGAGPERPQLGGETIVASEARDLFGEINVAVHVVPPARRGDLENILCLGRDPVSDCPEIPFYFVRLDRLAE